MKYQMTRRNFIWHCTLSLGLTSISLETIFGCASLGRFDPGKDYSSDPKSFNIKAFDAWFERNKLYTGTNPNIQSSNRGGKFPTFKGTLGATRWMGATPGIDYYANVMVAAAPGKIIQVKGLDTGRMGGDIVTIKHYAGFVSRYAHLENVLVDYPSSPSSLYYTILTEGKEVARGEPIGTVMNPENAKFILKKNNLHVNPDRYGMNHSYLDYPKILVGEKYSKEAELEAENKSYKQIEAYQEFLGYLKMNPSPMINKNHYQKLHYTCFWSMEERMQYLSELYKANSALFSGVDVNRVEKITRKYYENQPIVFSLPVAP